MGRLRFVMLLCLGGITAMGGHAGTVVYPSAKTPRLSVKIPDAWNPHVDKDGNLYAESETSDAWVACWIVNGKGVKQAATGLADDMADDVAKAEFGEPEKVTINGLAALVLNGKGVETENDKKVSLNVVVFAVPPDSSGVLCAVSYRDTSKASTAAIEALFGSLQPLNDAAKVGGATPDKNAPSERDPEDTQKKRDPEDTQKKRDPEDTQKKRDPEGAQKQREDPGAGLKSGEWKPYVALGEQVFPSLIVATATLKADEEDAHDPHVIGAKYGFVGAVLAGGPANGKVRLVVKPNRFMDETVFDATLQEGGKTYEIYPTINYKFDELLKARQVQPLSLVMELFLNGVSLGQRTTVVTVRSLNDCPLVLSSGGEEGADDEQVDLSWMFAAYVNENHPWVDKLTREALQAGVVDAFTGYQGDDPNAVVQQVYAVWNVLQRRGMKYSSITTSSAESDLVFSQHVRLFDEAVSAQQANCVDGTVLFAAVLRKIGLDPYLVLIPGHMFLAFDTSAEGGGKHLVGLETTMMGNTDLKRHDAEKIAEALREKYKNGDSWKAFEAAVDTGTNELEANMAKLRDENAVQYQLISVADARHMGILPLAYRKTD